MPIQYSVILVAFWRNTVDSNHTPFSANRLAVGASTSLIYVPYWDGSDLKIPLLSHRFEPHHPVVVGSPCWDRTNAQLYQPCARVKVWSLNRLANGLYLLICGWRFAPHINPSLPSHSYQVGSFTLITGRWIWTTADSNEWCSVYYCHNTWLYRNKRLFRHRISSYNRTRLFLKLHLPYHCAPLSRPQYDLRLIMFRE